MKNKILITCTVVCAIVCVAIVFNWQSIISAIYAAESVFAAIFSALVVVPFFGLGGLIYLIWDGSRKG